MGKQFKRNGKFVGAYVAKSTKQALQDEARRMDRPVAWVIKKLLAEGVKHLNASGSPANELKEAA